MLFEEPEPDSGLRKTGVVGLAGGRHVTFDVPVYDHVAMEIVHPLQDLLGVFARQFLWQGPVCFQLVLYGALR